MIYRKLKFNKNMKEDNPWESNKQEINHKYNAHVCCKTLGDALDAYTFLLYRGYSLANTHSPQALRTVLSLNRHIATEDHGASCCGIKTLEESARWHKYIEEKNGIYFSNPGSPSRPRSSSGPTCVLFFPDCLSILSLLDFTILRTIAFSHS